jgi:hypothetical protein
LQPSSYGEEGEIKIVKKQAKRSKSLLKGKKDMESFYRNANGVSL